MNIIQKLLVKLLSAETKAHIARNEDFSDRECLGFAVKQLSGVTTYEPGSFVFANLAQRIVENTHVVGVNHLVAEKEARKAFTEHSGVTDKDKLTAMVALGKVLRHTED